MSTSNFGPCSFSNDIKILEAPIDCRFVHKNVSEKSTSLNSSSVQRNFKSRSPKKKSKNLRQINALPITKEYSALEKRVSACRHRTMLLCKAPPHLFAHYALKGVAFGSMSLGAPSKSAKQNVLLSVNKLSGSPHLAKAFQSIAPWLATQLQELLLSSQWGEVIQKYLKGANSSFQQIIDTLLPKIFLNIAKNAKEHSPLEYGKKDVPFSFVDAFSFLIDTAYPHLAIISGKVRQLESIADPIKRERKLKELFIPLSHELLSVILPEGEKELPFFMPLILGHYWLRFKDHWFPEILLGLYRQFSLPFQAKYENSLLQRQGGDEVISIAKNLSSSFESVLPGLFASQMERENKVQSSLTKNLTAAFLDICIGSFSIKSYLEKWMKDQLEMLNSPKHVELKPLWKLLSSYAELLLLHVFSHLVSVPPSLPLKLDRNLDAIKIISIKLTAIISGFFNAAHSKIKLRQEECQRLGLDVYTDTALLQICAPLVDHLFSEMGLHQIEQLPLPFLKLNLVNAAKVILTSLILKQYLAITHRQFDNETCQQNLRNLLFDSKFLRDPHIAISIITLLYQSHIGDSHGMSERFHQELWEKSGTETLVKTIEKICSVITENVVDVTCKRLGILQQLGLKPDVNPFMKNALLMTKQVVESIILQCVMQIIETTREPSPIEHKEHPRTLFGFQISLRLLNMISRNLKNIDGKLKEIDHEYLNDPKRRAHEIRKAFLPLSSELHSTIPKNPLGRLPFDGMPGAELLKDWLWGYVKTDILPDLLYKNYQELMFWCDKKQDAFDLLEEQYHTTHLFSACRVLAQFASDFIRHYLLSSHEDLAKIFFSYAKNYFENISNPDPFVLKVFDGKESVIVNLLSRNIGAFGASDEDSLEQLWPFLTVYIESALAIFFSGLSSTIQAVETDYPDFMIDMAIKMLKVTSDYFNTLHRLAQNHGNDHLYHIDSAALLAGFGLDLHPGVPLDPSRPDSEKDRTRLHGWLEPLANKLMRLAKMKSNEFSLPAPIRKPLGQVVYESIVPQILLSIDKVILEPQTKDALVLSMINMLYAALNSIESTSKEPIPDTLQDDVSATRKRLNGSCGMVVLGMVKLIPDTMVQYVFMKEKVKDMSAEVIGNAIMAYLSKWTLLQLIDLAVLQILPLLHPSKWEGKAGREILRPRKLVLHTDGSKAFQSVKKFEFLFPANKKAIAEENQRKLKESYEVRKLLRDGFTKTISSQIFVNAWSLIKTVWKRFQEKLDAYLLQHFPQYGMQIKDRLDPIFRKVFFDFLGPVVAFLGYPFVQFVKYIIEKIHIDRKSEDIIKNLHSSSLEHLLYSWIDIIIDTLVELDSQRTKKRDIGKEVFSV